MVSYHLETRRLARPCFVCYGSESTRTLHPSPLSRQRRFPATVFLVLVFTNHYLTNVMRHLVGESVGTAAVTLLRDGELDTLALGEGNPRLLLSDDEDVGLAGSEDVVNGIWNTC